MNTSRQKLHWRVVGASVCGTSHVKNSLLCQDAHHWQMLPDNILVAAAADGAGSASLGKVGAMVAVEAAIENITVKQVNQSILASDSSAKALLSESILAAKTAVEEEAIASNRPPKDLSTTLIIVVATPNVAVVAQVGDGVAVVKDSLGNLTALTVPDSGEYINETSFLTSPTALDSVQVNIWRQGITNIAILTDGLQMLAINMAVGLPHKPFFLPLFDFVANAEELKGAKEQLVKFLRSEKITQRTDDDLTLIIAALSD
ncbi:MAG: PP2C family serine/threonine-protein phosphatase [Nostocales cyanobacterium 94392]|nr:PP2C family serine/threonine-protein phosphatase [Nostocales cyanobacterium 94392]